MQQSALYHVPKVSKQNSHSDRGGIATESLPFRRAFSRRFRCGSNAIHTEKKEEFATRSLPFRRAFSSGFCRGLKEIHVGVSEGGCFGSKGLRCGFQGEKADLGDLVSRRVSGLNIERAYEQVDTCAQFGPRQRRYASVETTQMIVDFRQATVQRDLEPVHSRRRARLGDALLHDLVQSRTHAKIRRRLSVGQIGVHGKPRLEVRTRHMHERRFGVHHQLRNRGRPPKRLFSHLWIAFAFSFAFAFLFAFARTRLKNFRVSLANQTVPKRTMNHFECRVSAFR